YKILPFLTEEKNFRNVIMLGMGKYGKLSRVLNHYFGFLTYVSVEEKTAEGQLSVREFEEILKILK
ncbi:MAG: 3-dehydroquinate dehydratase, partial [Candidatus Altiarchaeales archaeon HGW-Altiarchaeales-2]